MGACRNLSIPSLALFKYRSDTPVAVPPKQDISNLRATLGNGKDQGLTTPAASGIYIPYVTPYLSVLIPTTQGLAFSRTTDEVLRIVYSSAVGAPGGAIIPLKP